MINLIRSEWIKFRSVRSTVVTLVIAGALVVLVAVLVANDIKDNENYRCAPASEVGEAADPPDDTRIPSDVCGDGAVLVREPAHFSDITVGVTFATLLFGVLGVQIIGQEYRFNTIRPTFTAAPRRWRVLVAKLVVLSAACAVVATVMLGICWLIGTAMLDSFEMDGVDIRVAWAVVLFSVLWAAAGMGVGAIVRQPVAGILIIIIESLIAEAIIQGVVKASRPWLPFNNGVQMTLRLDEGGSEGLRPILEGGIYFAIVCAILWVVGGYLVNRRDA